MEFFIALMYPATEAMFRGSPEDLISIIRVYIFRLAFALTIKSGCHLFFVSFSDLVGSHFNSKTSERARSISFLTSSGFSAFSLFFVFSPNGEIN